MKRIWMIAGLATTLLSCATDHLRVLEWHYDTDSQHPVTFEMRVDNAEWMPIQPDKVGDLFKQRVALPPSFSHVAVRACDTQQHCAAPALVTVKRR